MFIPLLLYEWIVLDGHCVPHKVFLNKIRVKFKKKPQIFVKKTFFFQEYLNIKKKLLMLMIIEPGRDILWRKRNT